MEQENNERKTFDASKSREFETHTVEKSLSMMASSLYKMGLGINSIRDELRQLNEINLEILKNSENKKE